MRVIITGGAGFIGSHLSETLLKEGHEITVLDNFSTGRKENIKSFSKDLKVIDCDFSVKGEWAKEFKSVNWVFHLAALADIVPSIQMPEAYFNANVIGTLNVLQACLKHNIERFIYSASSSCYGIPSKYPTEENSSINCQYPYALTKRMGEEMVLHWSNLYNLPALSLRFFNVYGTRSRTSGTYGAVFGVFLAQRLANAPLTIVGDGTQTRDFTYVSDIVSAIIKAIKSDLKGKVYNVGSGKTVAINKLVSLLSDKYEFIPKRPGEPDCTFADISKIKKDLKWCPKISLEEGVNIILENIEYWKDAPLWDSQSIAKETKDWFKYLGKKI